MICLQGREFGSTTRSTWTDERSYIVSCWFIQMIWINMWVNDWCMKLHMELNRTWRFLARKPPLSWQSRNRKLKTALSSGQDECWSKEVWSMATSVLCISIMVSSFVVDPTQGSCHLKLWWSLLWMLWICHSIRLPELPDLETNLMPGWNHLQPQQGRSCIIKRSEIWSTSRFVSNTKF